MGIKDFYKWINSQFENIYVEKKKFTNIYIDINYLLHYCSYGGKSFFGLRKKIINKIEEILTHVEPIKKVILSIDGPSSFAKIILQRNRRKNMMKKMDNINDIENSAVNFTAGTKFIGQLNTKLKKYINKQNTNISYKLLNCKNEGDIEIIGEIKKNKGSHFVLSYDADSVIGAIATGIKKIYVGFIKNGELNILSIDNLINEHIKKYGSCKFIEQNITLCHMLMGNDYLPKLNYININNIFDTLKKKNKSLLIKSDNTNPFILNRNNFMDFIFNIFVNQNNIQKKNIELNFNKIKIYLEGLIWCVNNYYNGKCDKYDYMCEYKTIHPLEILFFLDFTKNKIEYPLPLYDPIETEIYAMLVIPLKANKLLNNDKYIYMQNKKLKFLYDNDNLTPNDIKKAIDIMKNN